MRENKKLVSFFVTTLFIFSSSSLFLFNADNYQPVKAGSTFKNLFDKDFSLSNDENIYVDLKIRKIGESWKDDIITGYVGDRLEFKIIIETTRNYALLSAAVSLPEVDNDPMFQYITNSEQSSKKTTFFEADDTAVFFSWIPVLRPVTITCTFQAIISEAGSNMVVNSTSVGVIDLEEDIFDYVSDIVNVTGQPSPEPKKPTTPSGATEGFVDETYVYTTSTTDPYNKNLSYQFNWGGGTYSDWIGPVSSGDSVAGSHKWENDGVYGVRVRAKNEDDFQSEWSDFLYVTISKKVRITNPDHGLYLAGSKIFDISSNIIIGKIEITVETPGLDQVDYVDFYIDGQKVNTDDSAPFSWIWNKITFGQKTVKVTAYSQNAEDTDSIKVWKFF